MFRLDYGEYIFQQLVTTEFVQSKLSLIFVSFLANFIQMHLITLSCYLVSSGNSYIDFVVQISISIILTLNIKYTYNFVERYQTEIQILTRYLIENYNINNYRFWKRIFILSLCLYSCCLLAVIRLTNWIILIYIIQYALCFLILEQIEQKNIQRWIENYKKRPLTLRYTKDPITSLLVESYLSPDATILKNPKRHVSQKRSGSIVHGRKLKYTAGITDYINHKR